MAAIDTGVAPAENTSNKVEVVQKPVMKASTNMKHAQRTQESNHESVSGCRKRIKTERTPGWFGLSLSHTHTHDILISSGVKIIMFQTLMLPFVKLTSTGIL